MAKALACLSIVLALVVAQGCTPAGQNANVATTNANASNSALPAPDGTTVIAAPAGTFAEGSPQFLIAHQPDYSADVLTVTGPTKIPGKIVKRGGNWRVETTTPQLGKTVIFIRAGAPGIILLEDKKQYAEVPADQRDVLVNPMAMTYEGLMQSGVKFEKVGSETIEGHNATKYRGSREGQPGEMFVYFAHDLKDLLIKLEAQIENQAFSVTWTNIAIDPPASSVDPPADLGSAYKKLSFDELQAMFSSGGDDAAPAAAAPAQGGN